MTLFSLDIRSADQPLVVARGDRIELQLDENRTTGFRWHVDDDADGIVTLTQDAFDRPHDAAIGAGGTRKLTFLVEKAGRANLRMSHRRPWEPAKQAHAMFNLPLSAT